MFSTLLDKIGDWNPQLIRELKGRLKPRNVMIAIAFSLITQLLIVGVFYSQLPQDASSYYSGSYCFPHLYDGSQLYSSCRTDAAGNILIRWPLWWTHLFLALSWCLPIALIVPAAYLLVADIEQEERRGTLNFIRLTPQSSWRVLLGKVLGVPILFYLGAALIMPLHLLALVKAGIPFPWAFSYYGLLFAGYAFIASFALLWGFVGKRQFGTKSATGSAITLLFVLFTLFAFLPAYLRWNVLTAWSSMVNYLGWETGAALNWFMLSLSNVWIAHLFTLFNLYLLTHWVWQALYRCFHMPNATLISKGQSYGLVAYSQIFLLGLIIPAQALSGQSIAGLLALMLVNLPAFLLLIVMLSNHRQTLLDWARYRHLYRDHQRQTRFSDSSQMVHKPVRFSLLQDLIWGEKSPAVVAIAINALIVATITGVAIALASNPHPWEIGPSTTKEPLADALSGLTLKVIAIAGIMIVIHWVALYASIAQLALFSKSSKRGMLAATTVGLTILIPVVVAIFLTSAQVAYAGLIFLFTPLPWIGLMSSSTPLATAGLTLLGQWLGLVLVNLKLTRQLRQAGESSFKQLLKETT